MRGNSDIDFLSVTRSRDAACMGLAGGAVPFIALLSTLEHQRRVAFSDDNGDCKGDSECPTYACKDTGCARA
jgi:hypothetical protein